MIWYLLRVYHLPNDCGYGSIQQYVSNLCVLGTYGKGCVEHLGRDQTYRIRVPKHDTTAILRCNLTLSFKTTITGKHTKPTSIKRFTVLMKFHIALSSMH